MCLCIRREYLKCLKYAYKHAYKHGCKCDNRTCDHTALNIQLKYLVCSNKNSLSSTENLRLLKSIEKCLK